MSQNETITVDTLVDTCNFPSIRFGRYYVGQLPNDTIEVTMADNGYQIIKETITHPEPSTTEIDDRPTGYTIELTDTGATVTNLMIQGLPSVVTEEDVERNTISGPRTIADSSFDVLPQFATTIEDGVAHNGGTATVVTSTFGGIASDKHVTRPTANPLIGPVTVIGKSCGPTP